MPVDNGSAGIELKSKLHKIPFLKTFGAEVLCQMTHYTLGHLQTIAFKVFIRMSKRHTNPFASRITPHATDSIRYRTVIQGDGFNAHD